MELGESVILTAVDGKRRTHIIVKCDYCNNIFPKMKRKIGKYPNNYCSKECTHKAAIIRKDLNCDFCGNIFTRKPSHIKHLNFCSRECKEKAQSHQAQRMLFCGLRTGVNSHRTIALTVHGKHCELCGYNALISLLDSHHIDHDRDNFDSSNLMVLCVMCHAAETRKLIAFDNRKPIPLNSDGEEFLKQIGA